MTDDIKSSVKNATSTAKQGVDQAAGQLQDVANQVGAIGGNVQNALDKSLAGQPYATLAAAAVVGFVMGAIWKS